MPIGSFTDENGRNIALDGSYDGPGAYTPDITWIVNAAMAVDSDLKVLGFIDPYGNTTLNRHMAECVSDDIDTILAAFPDIPDDGRNALERFRVVADACVDQTHTYIHFIGD